MSIIDKVKRNIKDFIDSKWLDEAFWIVLVIFAAIGSFSLGMRHQRDLSLQQNPISIQENDYIVEAWQEYMSNKKLDAKFFASKNGTVYYPLGCTSGNRIHDENRVYFETADEARSAGYKQSTNCN